MLADFLEKNHIQALNQSIDESQIDRLKTNLKDEINEKQEQIHRLYSSKKDDLTKIDQQTRKLIDQCEQFEAKRQALSEQVEEYSKLENQARLVNSNYHEIHRLNQFIHGLQQLIELENRMKECRQLREKGNLSEAKTVLESINLITEDSYLFPTQPERSAANHVPFYETLQRSLRQLRSEIFQCHTNLWNDGVNRQKKDELMLKTTELDRLFQCTFYEDNGEKNLIEKHIQTLANHCLQSFIHELIEKPTRLTIEEDSSTKIIHIRLENDETVEENRMERFDQVLTYLKEFFHILNLHLLSRTVKIQPINDKPLISISVMNIFATNIVNELIELIRENLLNLIPDDVEQIEMFRRLLKTTKTFEQYLIQIKFVTDDRTTNYLSSVVGNVDEAIIKSRCRTYLMRSRKLLQSNAIVTTSSWKTVQVGDDEELFKQNEEEKERHKQQISNNLLSTSISLDELDANIFRFPRTTIVEHVKEYIDFVRTVLHEADKLDHYAAHLCATARNMMELFHVIYANLHNKKAQEVPYLAALQFNTYMYMAHECLILGEEYYHLKKKTADGQPITFVDFVPLFRNQAMNLLQTQLDMQRETLISFIREIGGFHNIVVEDQSQDLLEKAINKSTLLIRNLSQTWRSIFSPYVYYKVMSYLCDYVSQLLIKETLSMEDIPEQECQFMVNAFTHWISCFQDLLVKDERSPGLNILARLAPNLVRFEELCLVLKSSLQTIVDRWCNGQGPLASHFTASEIKQLIRALFQTSERRTAALSKIQ